MPAESLDVRAVFDRALELAKPERKAYLDRVRGAAPETHEKVEALLSAHEQAGSFMEGVALGSRVFVDDAIVEAAGMQIGPYKLLEQIGEGGFGVVFLAEQARPVRRRVALKVIKPGMDTREVIGRFEAERQALALMDHPNIAKVFDAGTTDSGRPYFVMELVQGVTITEYCDQCSLTARERLELLITVCRAVQHAHQKGVIHRDLKPTNVLVAMQDGRPAPIVIDFGVAKAINQRLTEHSLTAGFAQLIGTPLYMSPEQAELSPLGADTRSDIYSLGVMMYELLTGSTPFDKERLHAASYDELRRIIREEDPPLPSTRLRTVAASLATTVAASRRTDVRRLLQVIRGELDWIVMKCLEKDRNRRYESASGLAADMQRFLNDEPVQACPPSAVYRLRKLAQRNKGVLLAGVVVATALVLGTAASSWQAYRATRAERQAQVNLAKARQVVNEYFVRVSESSLLEDPTFEPLRKELLHAALGYYQDFVKQNADDSGLRAELAAAYFRVSYIHFVLGSEEDLLTPYEHGLALLEDLVRTNSNAADLWIPHTGRFRVAPAQFHVQRPAEALGTFKRARSLLEEMARQRPDSLALRADVALCYMAIGTLQGDLNHWSEAAEAKKAACEHWNQLALLDPEKRHYQAALVTQSMDLSQYLERLWQMPEAEEAARQSHDLAEQLVQQQPTPNHRALLGWSWLHQAGRLERAGELEAAEDAYRRASTAYEQLARDYPKVPRYRTQSFSAQCSLGCLFWESGRHAKAATTFREALATAEHLHEDDAEAQIALARFFASCPDPQFRDARKAAAAAQKAVARNPHESEAWYALGLAQCRLGDWHLAIDALQKSDELSPVPDGWSCFTRSIAHAQLGDADQARRWYDAALDCTDEQDAADAELRRLCAEAAALLDLNDVAERDRE